MNKAKIVRIAEIRKNTKVRWKDIDKVTLRFSEGYIGTGTWTSNYFPDVESRILDMMGCLEG